MSSNFKNLKLVFALCCSAMLTVCGITNSPSNQDVEELIVDAKTVALWNFNECSGSRVIDASGNSYHMTAQNYPEWTSSGSGCALRFYRSYASVDNYQQDLFFSPEITVQARIRVDSLPSVQHSMIVSTSTWGYPEGCRGYELRLTGSEGKLEFVIGSQDNWHSALSTRTILTGKWYTISGQFDGSRISLYVDNELWAERAYAGSITPSEVGFHVARRIVDQPFWFSGTIDQIRVSNIARFQ